MNTLLGYPNEATKTTTYARITAHDDLTTKKGGDVYFVPVKGVFDHIGRKQLDDKAFKGKLNAGEKGRFKKQDVLDGENAFKRDI